MISEEKIKREIHKRKELNKVYNANVDLLNKILKEYHQHKFTKTDGTKLKEIDERLKELIKPKVEPFKKGHNATISYIYVSVGYGSVSLKISLCFNGGSYDDKSYYCEYHEDYFYLGYVDKQILRDITEQKKREDLNEDEQINAIRETEKAKKIYDEAKDKVKIYSLKEYL